MAEGEDEPVDTAYVRWQVVDSAGAAEYRSDKFIILEQLLQTSWPNPAGKRAVQAHFALADAYVASGDKDKARLVLKQVKHDHPHTSYEKQVDEKLKKL